MMSFPVYLAPMAGFTDVPFRRICSEMGADGTVTEMISAAAVCYDDKKTYKLAAIDDREAPCAVQIFGHDPSMMANAAEKLLEYYNGRTKPCFVDINMGCPVKKIVTPGDGSALMKEPPLAARIVRSVREVTDRHNITLSVKIRAGWDKGSINAPYFAALMADSGAELITVHGRTREQMYSPSSDNEVVRLVREAVPDNIPVIGNGDINTAGDAVRMIDETGCNGVAVGRAALGNVWLFSEIKAVMCGKSFTSPTAEDRVKIALRLVKDVVAEKGEVQGIRESRGRAAHFIRGLRGSSAVRDALNHAETLGEFIKILERLL